MSSGSAHPAPGAPGAPGAAAEQRKVASAPGRREVFRLAPPLVFWWMWVAFAAANLADFAIQGTPSARFTTVVTAVLVTVTGLAYVLALRPKVIASDTGITVVNPFRDHQIPWGMVQAVDTGDWVRVHYAPAGEVPGGKARSSVSARTVYCWALYVSARTKRRAGRAVPRPASRARLGLAPGGMFARRWPTAGEVSVTGFGSGSGDGSRLPEEARYLASLPVVKAIATRLDTRARQERARVAKVAEAGTGDVTARWAWTAVAAVAVPSLALLAVALA